MAKLSLREVKLSSSVKRANQRLRELEKQGRASESGAYGSIKEKSEKGASYLGKTRKGQIKFRTDIGKMTAYEKRELEHQVNKFLYAQTSTVKGIKKERKKGFETAKKRYSREYTPLIETGVTETELSEVYKEDVMDEMGLTENEYYDLWGSQAVQNMSKLLGSERVQQVIMATPQNTSKEDVLNAFKKAEKENHDFIEMIEEDFGYSIDKNANVVPGRKEKKLLNKFRK